MMLMTDIHVRSFTGSGLKPYLHSLAKLRTEVFREFPYLEEPNLEKETHYIQSISSCKETIAVLIFDNTTLVGAALGMPMSIEESAVQKPFKDKQLDIDSHYFFGDSVLLKPYRGRGIGHHFYDAREAHVQNLKKYKHICFCVPDYSESDPQKPEDFLPLIDFWRKRGYMHHPEMKCSLNWVALGEAHPCMKQMSFWMKDVH